MHHLSSAVSERAPVEKLQHGTGSGEGAGLEKQLPDQATPTAAAQAATRQKPGGGCPQGADCTEPWVFRTDGESWNTTSNTDDVLYGD